MRQLSRLSPLLVLAVAVGFATACADSAPTNVFADAPLLSKASAKTVERPLSGSCTTDIYSSVLDQQTGILTLDMTGVCNLSHLGRTTLAIHQICSVFVGNCSNSTTHTAANGDLMYGKWSCSPLECTFLPNGAIFGGTATIEGGTGRFINATGSGQVHGTATTDPVTGVSTGQYTMNGTISY